MIVVLIAGGAGTRLWPLSSPETPKHLLKLIGKESLLQASYRRAKQLTDKIYVITEPRQIEDIKAELPDLGPDAFIVEPEPRGTANCFVAGLHYVASKGYDLDEPIAFNSADHFIRDTRGFVQSFKVAEKASRKHGKIVQVGVEPTYPATGFGYIHKNGTPEDDSLVYEVLSFKEKPELSLAKKYLRSGEYLWNCSYYVGSVNSFLRDIAAYSPSLMDGYNTLTKTKTRSEYEKAYRQLPVDTIDYAFAELVPPKTFLTVPASFDWIDVGSFADLQDAVEKDDNGNYISDDSIVAMGVENSYIRNEVPGQPVIVIGLDNVVVVKSPIGLLVARKDLSPKVKEGLKELKDREDK